jgi:hypothetical protein
MPAATDKLKPLRQFAGGSSPEGGLPVSLNDTRVSQVPGSERHTGEKKARRVPSAVLTLINCGFVQAARFLLSCELARPKWRTIVHCSPGVD